jgi:hypothetical protein
MVLFVAGAVSGKPSLTTRTAMSALSATYPDRCNLANGRSWSFRRTWSERLQWGCMILENALAVDFEENLGRGLLHLLIVVFVPSLATPQRRMLQIK